LLHSKNQYKVSSNNAAFQQKRELSSPPQRTLRYIQQR